MKFSKFGILAGTALLISMNVAHADVMGQPSAAQVAQTEAAKNQSAPEIGKIFSNTMSKISEGTKSGLNAVGDGLGSGMQTVGKGIQNMSEPSKPTQEVKDGPNFTPVKPGFIDNLRKKFNENTTSPSTEPTPRRI